MSKVLCICILGVTDRPSCSGLDAMMIKLGQKPRPGQGIVGKLILLLKLWEKVESILFVAEIRCDTCMQKLYVLEVSTGKYGGRWPVVNLHISTDSRDANWAREAQQPPPTTTTKCQNAFFLGKSYL